MSGVTTPFIVIVSGLVGAIVMALIALVPATMREATIDAVRRGAIDAAEQLRMTHERYAATVSSRPRLPAPKGVIRPVEPPSPSAFLQDLVNETRSRPNRFEFLSPFPWPGREPPAFDEFRKQAWKTFQRDPNVVFTNEETLDGQRHLRLAVPVRMTTQSCVDCHNGETTSPKRDWAMGDVAGMIEMLTLQQNTRRIGRYFPEGALPWGSKTGTVGDVSHDAGFVRGAGGDMIIVVFTRGFPVLHDAEPVMGEIARLAAVASGLLPA